MARTTRTRKASALGTTGIIADTAEQEAKKVSDIAGDEIIYIACGMPLGAPSLMTLTMAMVARKPLFSRGLITR